MSASSRVENPVSAGGVVYQRKSGRLETVYRFPNQGRRGLHEAHGCPALVASRHVEFNQNRFFLVQDIQGVGAQLLFRVLVIV